MLASHEDALRADFQRFYGLSLDDMGDAYSFRHAAALCANLPDDSAVFRAEGDGWTGTQQILASIGRGIDVIWWQRTDAGQKPNAEPPDNYISPHERRKRARAKAVPIDERKRIVAEAYGYDPERM